MKLSVYMQKHEKACFAVTFLVTVMAYVSGYFQVLAAAIYALIAIDWLRGKLRVRSDAARSTGSR